MEYERYKQAIADMMNKLEESDIKIMQQIYTIIHQYLRKRGR